MAAARFTSPGKNVLQQTNNNVPVITELREEYKPVEKDGGMPRRKRRSSQETENRVESPKLDKSVASKLRKVRLGTSSHKLSEGMPQVTLCRGSSDESCGEEDREQEDGGRTRKPTPRPIIPNYVTKSDEVQLKKKKKPEANALDLSSQIVREAKPQAPMSIAKRNARERNRVKLVNQGFALLRSRIPDYISEIYTEERKKKKVSKVETLRMALGYIRHLTEMLDLRSADPSEWLRIKTNDPPASWSDASGSKTGYPSPVSAECPSPATTGIYGSEEQDFYDYQLEVDTVKDLSMKGAVEERESLLLEESDYSTKEDELIIVDDRAFEMKDESETLSLSSDAFPIDVGCCYDLVKVEPDLDDVPPDRKPQTERQKNKLVLPSITESFPKKNLRIFYQTPPFLTESTAFHV